MAVTDAEKMAQENLTATDAERMEGEKGMETVGDVEQLRRRSSIAMGEIYTNTGLKTQRGLKSRHAQMIAIGGTIGTGLFVGSGQALAHGGAAFLFMAYLLISFLVYGIVTALTEMSTYMPLEGSSMAYFAARYHSKSLGFAMGWLYWYSFAIIIPYEITAAGLVISYWHNSVPLAVWLTIMIIVIVGLNFFPVKVYGETEFWFASVKVFTLIGLLILSFILFWGGGPSHDRLGFRYWKNGEATKAYIASGPGGRFTAFVWVCVYSCFSFEFAPELLVITGGEMVAPRRNLPTAARRYIYRLFIFYVFGAFAIGVICNSTSRSLTHGGAGAGSSPWVVAIKNAGIPVLPSLINAVIITSAWSSGNSYLYMSSRTLYSTAMSGNAPKIFTRCNKYGVPYPAVIASALFCSLAYLSVSSGSSTAFNWFISLTNTSGFLSWTLCCLIYLNFRKATFAQGITVPYRSWMQPWMSYISGTAFALFCLLNGFTVFYSGEWNVSNFLTAYIGIPIFFLIYLSHRWYTRKTDGWKIPPGEVDLQTGLDVVEALDLLDPPKYEKGKGPWYYRINFLWE